MNYKNLLVNGLKIIDPNNNLDGYMDGMQKILILKVV